MKINHQIPSLEKCFEILVDKPEFKVIKKRDYIIFDYNLNDSHTFDDPESLEMRGIAFNEADEVVSLGLHKFFNLGEKPNQDIRLDGEEEAFEKLDGCVSGDSVLCVMRDDYSIHTIRMSELSSSDKYVYAMIRPGEYGFTPILNSIVKQPSKKWVSVMLENGFCIKCTEDHKILTNNGFKQAKDLDVNDDIVWSSECPSV